MPAEHRARWLFRGQSDARWQLRSTLDRGGSFFDDSSRSEHVMNLLNEFRREAIRLGRRWARLPNSDGFELLARHYGLPSPILDWTETPYVAAFFAFADLSQPSPEHVSVYALDRSAVFADAAGIEIIDDLDLLRFNRRALLQRSVFLRVSSTARSVEDLLGKALVRFVIPTSERRIAVTELSEMMIDDTHLFLDADAAARTAAARLF